VFRAANNELVGIVDIHNGGRMLAYGDNPLWKLTMASPGYMPDAERSLEEVSSRGLVQRLKFKEDWPGTSEVLEVLGNKETATHHRLSRDRQQVKLALDWSDISVGDEDKVISVKATVTADAGSP